MFYSMHSFISKTLSLKDTNRKKTLSNKTAVLTESMNMDNWVALGALGASNQHFIRDS